MKKSWILVCRYAKSHIVIVRSKILYRGCIQYSQDELEKLNVAANSINHLEAELDVSMHSVPYM